MQQDSRHDADSGNDSTNQILVKEKLIDPGNEHTHDNRDDTTGGDNQDQNKRNADAGNDGTGTASPDPAKLKKEPFDTSGEDG